MKPCCTKWNHAFKALNITHDTQSLLFLRHSSHKEQGRGSWNNSTNQHAPCLSTRSPFNLSCPYHRPQIKGTAYIHRTQVVKEDDDSLSSVIRNSLVHTHAVLTSYTAYKVVTTITSRCYLLTFWKV